MESESGLPNYGKFSSFCEPRIREIKALESDLNNCEHGLRAFQKLPRNMQRRNVSYNPQRLPHYLREKHKREIGNKIKASKRPCRKYRRRPANLLAEYNRRQRDKIWLETHIWHAKRFHMIKKWGYVLPKTPTFKAFRATLRAATDSCMIQDVSYECCLEIEGSPTDIHERLSSLMPPNEETKIFDSDAINGYKWIETTLYKQFKFPCGFIGDVQIICSSQSWNKSSYKLWLWVHPSIFEEVLSTLIEVFNYKLTEDDKEPGEFKAIDQVTEAKLSTKNIPIQKTPTYTSESTKLTVLKDTLVKFRVIGPGSYSLLQKVLIPSEVVMNNNYNDDDDKECDTCSTLEEPWWVSFFSNPDHVARYHEQLSSWTSLKEDHSISRKIISLVVRDVRALLPSKKHPLKFEEVEEPNFEEKYCSSSLHPILDSDIRESVIRNMKSNHVINKERENILVPGTSLPLTENESRVPVMLLQRPGSHVSGRGSGWDMILPSGWATQTLIACVLNGAVVGGQDEEESLMREFLTQPRPYHSPDSKAGLLYSQEKKREREDTYFRRPPNCRLNYLVLGIKFPFGIDWMELMKDWNSSCEEFYVLRDKIDLKSLSILSCKKIQKIADKRSLKRKALEGSEEKQAKKFLKTEEYIPVKIKNEEKIISRPIKDIKNSLLYVRIILLGKGSIEPFATLCLPTDEDLLSFSELKRTEIVEPPHEDRNSKKRTELKVEHKANLKHLRRKRKKARNEVLCSKENPLEKHSTMQEAMNAAIDVVTKKSTDVIQNILSYNNNYNDLWLQNPGEPFQSNSRKIIGYLTNGGYCMRMGRSGGLGYVVTEALLDHMTRLNVFEDEHKSKSQDTQDEIYNSNNQSTAKQILMLTRNPSCFQYKWARLVILNV